MAEQSYTIKEASEQLSVAEITIRKWIRSGRIGAHLESRKHGMTWILSPDDIRSYRERTATLPAEVYAPAMGDQLSSMNRGISLLQESSTTVIQEIRDLAHMVAQLEQEIRELRSTPPKKRKWWQFRE